MNMFEVGYTWYEDDHDETLLAKDVEREQFERDLKEAVEFAKSLLNKEVKFGEDYLGRGYAVSCLPEYYEQVIWYLTTKLGYVVVEYDDANFYLIDDDYEKKIISRKRTSKFEWVDL